MSDTMTEYVFNGVTYSPNQLEDVFAEHVDETSEPTNVGWFTDIQVSHWIKATYPNDWRMAFEEWKDTVMSAGELVEREITWDEYRDRIKAVAL